MKTSDSSNLQASWMLSFCCVQSSTSLKVLSHEAARLVAVTCPRDKITYMSHEATCCCVLSEDMTSLSPILRQQWLSCRKQRVWERDCFLGADWLFFRWYWTHIILLLFSGGIDMARLFNHVLLQQTQPEDSQGAITLSSMYTSW